MDGVTNGITAARDGKISDIKNIHAIHTTTDITECMLIKDIQ